MKYAKIALFYMQNDQLCIKKNERDAGPLHILTLNFLKIKYKCTVIMSEPNYKTFTNLHCAYAIFFVFNSICR